MEVSELFLAICRKFNSSIYNSHARARANIWVELVPVPRPYDDSIYYYTRLIMGIPLR